MVPNVAGFRFGVVRVKKVRIMSSTGLVRKAGVTLDVNELELEAAFWGAILGQEPGPIPSGGGWLTVGELPGGGWLVLQTVPEKKTAKIRMHLDFNVDDVDKAVGVITELGGMLISGPRRGGGVTMIDPEGNEFCLGAFTRSKEGVRTPGKKSSKYQQ